MCYGKFRDPVIGSQVGQHPQIARTSQGQQYPPRRQRTRTQHRRSRRRTGRWKSDGWRQHAAELPILFVTQPQPIAHASVPV